VQTTFPLDFHLCFCTSTGGAFVCVRSGVFGRPHGGPRPFHQQPTSLTCLMVGSYVVHIWSRVPRISEVSKPADSTVCTLNPRPTPESQRRRCQWSAGPLIVATYPSDVLSLRDLPPHSGPPRHFRALRARQSATLSVGAPPTSQIIALWLMHLRIILRMPLKCAVSHPRGYHWPAGPTIVATLTLISYRNIFNL